MIHQKVRYFYHTKTQLNLEETKESTYETSKVVCLGHVQNDLNMNS